MKDQHSFGFECAIVSFIVVLLGLVITIRLLPLLLHVLWQLVPGVVALWLIVTGLAAIVKKLLN